MSTVPSPPKADVTSGGIGPVAAEEAHSGFAFVRDVLRDFSSLQNSFAGLRDQTSQLRSDVDFEQAARKEDSLMLRRDMLRSLEEESKLRVDLQTKHEAFQNLSKQWVGALGQDGMVTKERVTILEASMEKRTSQANLFEERISKLEHAVALRCTISDFTDLSATVTMLQAEVTRDRTAASNALEAVSKEAFKGIRSCEAGLEALIQKTDTSTQALNADVSSLFAKVESLQNHAKLLASAKDLELLADRMREAEKALKEAQIELSKKAAAANLKSVSDRLTEFALEAHTQQTRNQSMMDGFTAKIGDLQKDTSKLDRLVESERTRTSNCIVALEKELATKADAETYGAKLATAANSIQRLETITSGKANLDDFDKLQARFDAAEVTLHKKAEATSLSLASQAISEQARHYQELRDKLFEQQTNFQAEQDRTTAMKQQLEQKAHASQVYPSTEVDQMFRRYYSKEEVDAIMSRVWWRLGDVSKSSPRPGTSPQVLGR
jgi:predicted nucleotidyltransferase